jgi:hypothetical protein
VVSIAVRVSLAIGDIFAAGQRARELLDVIGPTESSPPQGGPLVQDRGLARVIALSTHVRVLMATGDLAAVDERMRQLHHATQCARTPLRLARMRLLLLDVYRRAGRKSMRNASSAIFSVSSWRRTAVERSDCAPREARRACGGDDAPASYRRESGEEAADDRARAGG